jgi:hypothetical protein
MPLNKKDSFLFLNNEKCFFKAPDVLSNFNSNNTKNSYESFFLLLLSKEMDFFFFSFQNI